MTDAGQLAVVDFLAKVLGELIIAEEQIIEGKIRLEEKYRFVTFFKIGAELRFVEFDSKYLVDSAIACRHIFILKRYAEISEAFKFMAKYYGYDDLSVDLIFAWDLKEFRQYFSDPAKPILTLKYSRIRFVLNQIELLTFGTETGKEWKDDLILYLGSFRKNPEDSAEIHFKFPYRQYEEAGEAFPKIYIPKFIELSKKYPKYFEFYEM